MNFILQKYEYEYMKNMKNMKFYFFIQYIIILYYKIVTNDWNIWIIILKRVYFYNFWIFLNQIFYYLYKL